MDHVLLLISGILGIFVLVAIFNISSNLAAIKTQLLVSGKKDLYGDYKKAYLMKRSNQEILYAAQEYVWAEMIKDQSKKKHAELHEIWSSRFISLGGEFPEYPFNK